MYYSAQALPPESPTTSLPLVPGELYVQKLRSGKPAFVRRPIKFRSTRAFLAGVLLNYTRATHRETSPEEDYYDPVASPISPGPPQEAPTLEIPQPPRLGPNTPVYTYDPRTGQSFPFNNGGTSVPSTPVTPVELRHRCLMCGRYRSRAYHLRFPLAYGQTPSANVCKRCQMADTSSEESDEDSSDEQWSPRRRRQGFSRKKRNSNKSWMGGVEWWKTANSGLFESERNQKPPFVMPQPAAYGTYQPPSTQAYFSPSGFPASYAPQMAHTYPLSGFATHHFNPAYGTNPGPHASNTNSGSFPYQNPVQGSGYHAASTSGYYQPTPNIGLNGPPSGNGGYAPSKPPVPPNSHNTHATQYPTNQDGPSGFQYSAAYAEPGARYQGGTNDSIPKRSVRILHDPGHSTTEDTPCIGKKPDVGDQRDSSYYPNSYQRSKWDAFPKRTHASQHTPPGQPNIRSSSNGSIWHVKANSERRKNYGHSRSRRSPSHRPRAPTPPPIIPSERRRRGRRRSRNFTDIAELLEDLILNSPYPHRYWKRYGIPTRRQAHSRGRSRGRGRNRHRASSRGRSRSRSSHLLLEFRQRPGHDDPRVAETIAVRKR